MRDLPLRKVLETFILKEVVKSKNEPPKEVWVKHTLILKNVVAISEADDPEHCIVQTGPVGYRIKTPYETVNEMLNKLRQSNGN